LEDEVFPVPKHHHATKVLGIAKVNIQEFLQLALDGGEYLA
jgi:hypothetical protein